MQIKKDSYDFKDVDTSNFIEQGFMMEKSYVEVLRLNQNDISQIESGGDQSNKSSASFISNK